MTPTSFAPAAPAYLPEDAATQWRAAYDKAFAQAKIDTPNNAPIQRATALKRANALLAIPAPESAADIDKLQAWQVRVRETRMVKGQQIRVCVTSDGRKYAFPIAPARPRQEGAVDLGKLSKAELVDHAQDAHGLVLDASSTKAELIGQINAHVEAASGASQS